jgi:uncharacterized protein (TIGR02246 family)
MSSADTISPDYPIRRLYEHILITWNQQDAAAVAARFEEDGNLVGFDGSQADSRAAIEDHLRPIFADHPTAAYVARLREIRMLGRDVGLLRAVAGMIPPNSDDISPALNTIHTLVAVEHAEGWRAALFQSTPAAWHGRPQDSAELTEELRDVMRQGLQAYDADLLGPPYIDSALGSETYNDWPVERSHVWTRN